MMIGEEHALEAVPSDQTVSGLRIAIVEIGIIIALPAFITGAEIGFGLGFKTGVTAVIIGGLILSAIAMATGTVGARTKLTTAMITKHTFGSLGGRLVSLLLALTCLGWFGVTAELFGKGIYQIAAAYGWHAVPATFYTVAGGGLMVTTTIFGFSALQRLSNITVPLLAILIAFTAYLTLRHGGGAALTGHGEATASIGDGISAIVGGLSVAVTLFPDYSRFSRSAAGARGASVLTFGMAMPIVLLLAMIPSIILHERDLMVIMTSIGLGVPALALLVVKAWATNSGNLYSASLSAANFVPILSQRTIVVMSGVIGIAFAAAGVSQMFIPFLVSLGVGIPPIAGIYVSEFLWVRRGLDTSTSLEDGERFSVAAFGSWATGVAVAIAARAGFVTLTGISACDSMLVAAVAYISIHKISSMSRIQKAEGIPK